MQDGALMLAGGLTDIELAEALSPYRKKYRRIHFKAPVQRALRGFKDASLQAEFDAVSTTPNGLIHTFRCGGIVRS